MKDESLSDKRKKVKEFFEQKFAENQANRRFVKDLFYNIEIQDKEAVKKLKDFLFDEETHIISTDAGIISNEIDSIFGEKLV